MSTNYYNYLDSYNYDQYPYVPSGGDVLTSFKRAIWDKFMPKRMISYLHSLWKIPTLNDIQSHKKEIGMLCMCGGAIFIFHWMLKDSKPKPKLDETADIPEINAEIINDNDIKNKRTRDEIQQELYLLVVDGNFGRTDILEQYGEMHRLEMPRHSMSSHANGGNTTPVMTDDEYEGSLTEDTSTHTVNRTPSDVYFHYEH